jgi:alpha-glucuronidase
VGANVIAKALKPHGGTLYWRCFIYNCLQDWRDTVTDRPKAAYDTFFPIDGKFDDNVILQVKHGPSDFQVREPNSPLLGAMKNTREALEFQISQEYTGQQKDLYAWAVQWEEVFDMPFNETRSTRDLIGKELEAVVAVCNTGNDENWCGHLMAQANLYAFGRMAWDAKLTAREVTEEWVALTFDKEINAPINKMMLESRHVYEKYNAPLGICWMVYVHPHYGPSPDGYEYAKWGTYHRADTKAIGVDRTRKGTGYTAQYQPHVRDLYENLETCPEEMVLYFHRLPYDYKLKDGRTMLQYIYDTHFEGVEEVEGFIKTWESLKGKMPEEAYTQVRKRFDMQLENAKEWRDVINSYFYRKTGIADAKGRKIYT